MRSLLQQLHHHRDEHESIKRGVLACCGRLRTNTATGSRANRSTMATWRSRQLQELASLHGRTAPGRETDPRCVRPRTARRKSPEEVPTYPNGTVSRSWELYAAKLGADGAPEKGRGRQNGQRQAGNAIRNGQRRWLGVPIRQCAQNGDIGSIWPIWRTGKKALDPIAPSPQLPLEQRQRCQGLRGELPRTSDSEEVAHGCLAQGAGKRRVCFSARRLLACWAIHSPLQIIHSISE